jgi:subtilisin-like proprotein convertase family protein
MLAKSGDPVRRALFGASLVAVLALVACGSPHRPGTGGDDDSSADALVACVPSVEKCDDGVDNDCDYLTDCEDPECSGVGTCPVCGMVEHPLSQPLALPDGDGAGPPYTSDLYFMGFGPTQTMTAASNIVSVCVNMEHSWIRDLQIELHAPDGKIIVLSRQLGNTGSEVYLGQANDDDDANNPVPGVGADYCWTPAATNLPILDYANANGTMLTVTDAFGFTHNELPPGNYMASDPWSNLYGTPLNGFWKIFVQDKWAIDNGFIFSWSIAFDPTLVQNCSTPPIQ